jgi:hypothetical protein
MCTKSYRRGVLVWASLSVDRTAQRKHSRSSETIMILIIEHRTKAVADGALSWYLDSSVSARVNKYFYGTETTIPWTMQDPEIANRIRFIDHAGDWRVNGFWSPIVAKVSDLFPPHASFLSCFRMHESRTASSTRRNTTSKYLRPRRTLPECATSGYIDGTSLHASSSSPVGACTFRPNQSAHYQTDESMSYPGFEMLCTVEANLRAPFNTAKVQTGPGGKKFKAVKVSPGFIST